MQALDADVIKAYVGLGLGVGIIASIAVDPEKDGGPLVKIGDELFEPIKSHIALRRGHYLRGYASSVHRRLPARTQGRTGSGELLRGVPLPA